MSTNQSSCPLTPRQLECVSKLAEGKHAKEIAHEMGVKLSSVVDLLVNCRRKAGVTKETALVAKAIREGWIQ